MNKIKYGKFAVNGGVNIIMLFLIKGIPFCYYSLIFNGIEAINHTPYTMRRNDKNKIYVYGKKNQTC